MLNFLNNILGYVEIEISGEELEKILNLAHKNKLAIWNLKYKNRSLVGKVKPKEFKKLLGIKKETNSKIRIVKRKGIIFKINKYRGRTGLLIGAILFFCILKGFSFFVLGVEIKSNKPIDKVKVASVLSENGIKEWTLRHKIDTNYAAQRIILSLPELDWASVNIEGSLVTVNLHSDEEKKSDTSPSNLVAKYDSIIKRIDVTSGETLKSIGDTVAKGEVLVSGVSQNAKTTVFEKSKGEIFAETKHTFSKSGYIKEEKYVYEKTKKRRVLNVFSLKIPLYVGSIKSHYSSKQTEKTYKVFGQKLPIGYTEKTFKLKTKKTVITKKEKLTEKLKEEIMSEIKAEKYETYKIENTDIKHEKNALTVEITVSALENIATEQKIRFEQ